MFNSRNEKTAGDAMIGSAETKTGHFTDSNTAVRHAIDKMQERADHESSHYTGGM